ncbi:MAG TPA: TRAP transporter large permease subunit [Stellaceae bacterium]|nr:TRAP transporter large permease subunit [Stellaceae bacterium]
MDSAGFWMLGLVAVLMIGSGLPAFIVLVGVSVLFAALGVAFGALPLALLTALPQRIVGLLENDLLQALPLYVAMGALLNRLPLADILFRAGNAVFARTGAAAALSAIGLGAMLAPMNGSVGASAATLARVIQPRLLARGVSPGESLAIVCVASTLGVVVPPSLVLILLGDAMLRAHTEAVNATGVLVRVINTQDVFRGALLPAAIFLLACAGIAWWRGRVSADAGVAASEDRVSWRGWATATVTLALIIGLLAAVVSGHLYAVEAAATGALALVAFGAATRSLDGAALTLVLRDTMAVTGALFALFVAATTFTLVFRGFGTDRLLAMLVAQLPGGTTAAAITVIVVLGLCAFVLDAFEIILVIVPLIMPALLARVPDAVWMSVLTLLALQASCLIPPFGYAVMMARTTATRPAPQGAVTRALVPFLAAQLVVLALTTAFPQLTHLIENAIAPVAKPALSDEEARRKLDRLAPPPGDPDR